jgi:hypothetical protein
MSTNCADYAELLDPGDGSLLTVTTNGMDSTLAALVPKFDHLKFSGGTLDAYGSDVRVPVLEGAEGTITNSNPYAVDGALVVGEKWILDGAAYSGGTLEVHGKVKFADGVNLVLRDSRLLSRKSDHVLVSATDGIEGIPAGISCEGDAEGWQLFLGKDAAGNDALVLGWRSGLVITVR